MLLVSCKESGRVSIKGELEEGRGKMIYLDRLNVEGPAVLDSAKIKRNGTFSFSAKISHPSFYNLRLSDNNFITLLAEPGETVRIVADASNLSGTFKVYGSEGSESIKKLNDRLAVTKKQIQPLIMEIAALEDDPDFEKEEARIYEEINEIIQAQRKFSIAFIMENMESLASITAIYQQLEDDYYVLNQVRDIQYMKILAQSLRKKYPESLHVKALAADAEAQERGYDRFRILNMAEASGNVHSLYPDIAMPGIDGDTVRLHSLQEKYILVFFGSSLNPGSVELSHDLIPVHQEYRNKGFQIYQVSVERDREEWLRSIRYSELPWVHVAEFGEGGFTAAQHYNVQAIPSNYLINRDAGIMAKNLSARELRRRLARALD